MRESIIVILYETRKERVSYYNVKGNMIWSI
jgi:hypothetical protein